MFFDKQPFSSYIIITIIILARQILYNLEIICFSICCLQVWKPSAVTVIGRRANADIIVEKTLDVMIKKTCVIQKMENTAVVMTDPCPGSRSITGLYWPIPNGLPYC